MRGITVKETINAPAEKVFAAATDLRGLAGRIRAIKRIEVLTEGPVRVGTKFKETRIMFGREATEQMEITALEAPRRWSTGAQSHGCRYDTEFTLAPAAGGTEITMRFQGEPLNLFTKIMGLLMAPMMKSMAKLCQKDLADLKASVEGTGPAAGPGAQTA